MSTSDFVDLRKAWRERWLLLIREFSDFDEQRREWLAERFDSPYYTYTEYMCRYFDDLGLDNGYGSAVSDGLVTDTEAHLVEHFHALADCHDSLTNDYDHIAILADSEWRKVVAAAEEARQALYKSLTDADEVMILRKTSQ